jgi:hypothetical protein
MTTAKQARTGTAPKLKFGQRIGGLFKFAGDLLSVLLVALENFQPSGQKVFQLLITG